MSPYRRHRSTVAMICRSCASAVAGLIAFASFASFAAEPTRPSDRLLELLPADSAVIVSLEGLRDHWNSPAGTRLVTNIRGLPFVQHWLDSDTFRHWEQSREQIETVLGVTLAQLRDDVIGDACILALCLDPRAPGAPPQPRGLLLVKPRDYHLLAQLIDAVNRAQSDSGELLRIDDRFHGDTAYHAREFPPESKRPPEYYTSALDGTFAMSNSEQLLHSVIDGAVERGKFTGSDRSRRTVLPGLARFQAVQRQLPATALARVLIEPRSIEALLSIGRESAPADKARLHALLIQQFAAVDYAGAALTLDESLAAVHLVEVFDAHKLDPAIRQWAGRASSRPTAPCKIPPTSVGVLSISIDFASLHRLIDRLIPDADQPKFHNLEALVTGMLLGQDFVTRVLPAVGPAILAYVDAPAQPTPNDPHQAADWLFPVVLSIDLSGSAKPKQVVAEPSSSQWQPSVTAAVDNALRTLMAILALDDKRAHGRSRIIDQIVAGARITSLDPPIPFAFAIDHKQGRLVLATSSAAVARHLEYASKPDASDNLERFRTSASSAFNTFTAIDLQAARRAVSKSRDKVIEHIAARNHRGRDQVSSDLDRLIQLSQLFQFLFIGSGIEPDASSAHQLISLVFSREKS